MPVASPSPGDRRRLIVCFPAMFDAIQQVKFIGLTLYYIPDISVTSYGFWIAYLAACRATGAFASVTGVQ